jgi:hypothetical protein
MKVHANFCLPAMTHFDPAGFIPSPAAGVNRFMLDRIGGEKATRATTIVQYQAHSKFPAHTHIGGEEYLVLAGTFHDEHGVYPVGTYVRNPVGTKHAPWVEGDGCTIWVKLLQMADNSSSIHSSDVDSVPMQVAAMRPISRSGSSSGSGSTRSTSTSGLVELYHNEKTGERVEMCWLDPEQPMAVDERTAKSEELFVVEGSLLLVRTSDDDRSKEPEQEQEQDTDTKNKDEYQKWAWLRFPVGSDQDPVRKTLTAGATGAQVLRKTGHLTEHALSLEKVQIADDETFRVLQ